MSTLKRAMSYNEALDNGLIPDDYEYTGLPEEFSATIQYKVWGRHMNVLLFLVDDEDGYKILYICFP